MKKDLFSSLNTDQPIANSSAMLNAVLNILPVSVCILKTIRRSKKIIDFEYLLVNDHARKNLDGMVVPGKTFLACNDNRTLFETFVNVEKTGSPAFLANSPLTSVKQNFFDIRCIKLREGILLVLEENTGDPQDVITNAVAKTKRKSPGEELSVNSRLPVRGEEIAGMGTWEYDLLTGGFAWSAGMYHLFNLPQKKKITPDIFFAHTPDEEKTVVSRIVNNIREGHTSFEETVTLLPHKKEKKIVVIKGVVTADKKRKPVKVTGIAMNTTLREKINEETSELNKVLMKKINDLEVQNSELKTFNTVASRDYSQTIQTLYTNFEYIVVKEAKNLSDTARANIRRAQSAIQKMKLLTEDINAYLRLYDMGINKSVINPNAVIENLLSEMKPRIEQAGATIETDRLPALYADPLLLSMLLHNLVDNGLKFRKLMVPTAIKIKYSYADEMNAVAAASENTSYNIISVADNGIGFENDEAEKVFELFFASATQANTKVPESGCPYAERSCPCIMALSLPRDRLQLGQRSTVISR